MRFIAQSIRVALVLILTSTTTTTTTTTILADDTIESWAIRQSIDVDALWQAPRLNYNHTNQTTTTTTTTTSTIHDLSKEFTKREPTPDSKWWHEKLSEHENRDIRRMLVIDNGEIVMEYERDNVPPDQLYQLWSMTKSFMLMFMGMVIDDDKYHIDYNTTLGEIFNNNNDDAWELIVDQEELDFKKKITLWELFLFQSGLSDGVLYLDPWIENKNENENENENKNTINTWYRVGLIPDPRNMPNLVGVDLKESLFIHAHHPNEKGQWKYLHFSNVLSYAMFQITGMTPLEFCLQKVFPYLGLTSNDIDWDTNDDGMQASFTNLRLHGRGIAKLAMLMMQGGKSSPTKQLLSKEYVETALSPLQWRTFNSVREPYETPFYEGFRWQTWISNDNDDNKDNDDNDNNNDNNYNDMPGITYASLGMWGQVCAFSLETNRLVVVQRSNTVTEALFFGEPSYFGSSEEFATMAMSKNFTFSSSLSAPTSSPTVLETVGNENENEKCYFFGWWCP